MKPPKFKYIAPESPEAVVRSLAEYNGEARCLSGGQSLIPLMNYRLVQPAALIDLNRCPSLNYLRRDGEMLVFGPMTRQATVEYSDLVSACCPLKDFVSPSVSMMNSVMVDPSLNALVPIRFQTLCGFRLR